MSKTKYDLTEKQKKACDNFLAGDNMTDAMLNAGYAETSTQHPTQSVFGRKLVREYIDEKLAQQLYGNSQRLKQMSKEAIEGIFDLATSSNTKENVKLKANKTIIDRLEMFQEQLGIDLSGQLDNEDSEDSGLTIEDIKNSNLDDEDTSKLIELLSRMKAED